MHIGYRSMKSINKLNCDLRSVARDEPKQQRARATKKVVSFFGRLDPPTFSALATPLVLRSKGYVLNVISPFIVE